MRGTFLNSANFHANVFLLTSVSSLFELVSETNVIMMLKELLPYNGTHVVLCTVNKKSRAFRL